MSVADVRDGAPRLALSDAAGKSRLRLSVRAEDGKPLLGLSDEHGTTRAVLGSTSLVETTKPSAAEQTAESSLVLFDEDGKVLSKLPR